MNKFLKQHWSLLLLILLCTLLLTLNLRPNYIIMGLDNASPYFNLMIVLERIKDTSTVIYGGILFQTPFLFLTQLLNISPGLISNIYLFGNLLLGILGTFFLLKKVTQNQIAALLGTLLLISSMLTFWIFSQPNFLFISAYGTIPFIILFLGKEKKKYYDFILLTIFTFSFLTVSLNVVALGIYIIQILLLTKILFKKCSWKTLAIWCFSTILFWLLILQVVQIVNGDNTFVLLNIFGYVRGLLQNSFMPIITQDILASEKTNSLLHTLSFSLGWTELHDASNIPIFEYYSIYRENMIYMLLGILPVLLALTSVFLKKGKKTLYLTILLLIFMFTSSKYGIGIIESLPYVSDIFRWASSKLWPIYIIPLTVLFGIFVENMTTKKNKPLKYLIPISLTFVMIIYSYPVLAGNLLSKKTLANIPDEYFELPQDSTILILPEPQKLYMREYEWGYYGSDFISYINNSRIVDAGNLYETAMTYTDILESRVVDEDIEYVVFDKSVRTKNEYEDILDSFVLINSNEYFNTYGRE